MRRIFLDCSVMCLLSVTIFHRPASHYLTRLISIVHRLLICVPPIVTPLIIILLVSLDDLCVFFLLARITFKNILNIIRAAI